MSSENNPKWSDKFSTRSKLQTKGGEVAYYSLLELQKKFPGIAKLPYSIRVLLESVLRQEDGFIVSEEDVKSVAQYQPAKVAETEIPFKPARVVMQDFTGVPGVVDLAAMRDAVGELGFDAGKINPVLPVDLVIDHSVQVDFARSPEALEKNIKIEFERNGERYEFLRWGAGTFDNFRVVPPATGIVHQVNLEYLANLVQSRQHNGEKVVYFDSCVGTDSHTTMINGLGVVGWGVGGIEAEAVMLEQPVYMLLPEVVGFKLTGELPEGATATDLVLTITQQLRAFGVVGKFVEFYGPGLARLSLADRATIANMAPEYGATIGFFPVDNETLNYMRLTGRSEELVDLVEKYHKAQGMFLQADSPEPEFTHKLELDMTTVFPSMAGPRRPQDRVALSDVKKEFEKAVKEYYKDELSKSVKITMPGGETNVSTGSVAIAAITSCTNTSNPSVMIAAGLVARKALAKGLQVNPAVKTSLAPGSRVVTQYLQAAGLDKDLDAAGFQTVGYGCTTCIGNSGPLAPEVSEAISKNGLVVAGVLSGNRNFEGRIHAEVKANYLASPPLVVAYAFAGNLQIDISKDPVGKDKDGKDVFLKDIWPSQAEIKATLESAVKPDLFRSEYGNVLQGNAAWNAIKVDKTDTYNWDPKSTYIRKPDYFKGFTLTPPGIPTLSPMRVLAVFGDSVTTDHISPAGNIKKDSPAGKWLLENGVEVKDFNSYGSRRGNHEVMMRGTFANIRIRNLMVPGVEGGYTKHIPSGEQMSIYDAAMKYADDKTPLIVLAGKEYGTGSSRDWAAKGTSLLGIKVVLAESFERIHRSNLIGMGILPLQFKESENISSFKFDGTETFEVHGYDDNVKPRSEMKVTATRTDGSKVEFSAKVRIDTPVEVEYLKNGGILQTVLRNLAAAK